MHLRKTKQQAVTLGNPGSLLSEDSWPCSVVFLVRGFPLLHINSLSQWYEKFKEQERAVWLSGTELLFSLAVSYLACRLITLPIVC